MSDLSELDDDLTADIKSIDFFGVGTNIPDNSDLNDYMSVGKYRVQYSANSQTIVNTPYASAGYGLFVFALGNTSLLIQLAITNSDPPYIYIRFHNQTWYGWRTIATTAT